ncbi:multiple resistance and pH regulation protein F [Alkalidesulfovibrio alkalitolerans DSM 16529]|jgi:multicomponent Na+:H+ antiporter subunit F|uniref:Multiple resistance and pH regulation protein F n=1 Tax=Alkalidesulfovibrio alkalitolerans DSM 16529 TaxID=1121439 RepID=S7T7J5_9BACT|nr:monovalent cation/H+ antiporter complex subunit F [Alkalidesulfovibrio alkalitolerans]EPR33092.1 multiple resistance and pH regulation protein F [Alkalidesulfovibrio alkalitolerans DSM 16529]
MHDVFLTLALVLGIVLLIPFYRVYKGPTLFDRLLGVAAVGSKTITIVLLFGLIYDRLDMFIDISLGYAILNFVGVIAMAKYLKASSRS